MYLKNIPGILDRNDTSYISDSSSIGMFQLDETAENQPQSAPISAKGTKDSMPQYLSVILYYPCFSANLYWQQIDLFGRLIFPLLEQLPQYFHENLKNE